MIRSLNGCMCQDGRCESCNRLVEAFEAMREALHVLETAARRYAEGKDSSVHYVLNMAAKARAALALADKVSR